jgi:hypothetical protein
LQLYASNWRVRVMVLHTTFNHISAISWQSDILVEETGVLEENHRPATSHWQTFHIMLYQVHLAMSRLALKALHWSNMRVLGWLPSRYGKEHIFILYFPSLSAIAWPDLLGEKSLDEYNELTNELPGLK